MKIVIVDDSKIVRERLADLLAVFEGIEIVGMAGDALQARNLIRILKPDVATIDIRMPKGNGIDLLRDVKKKYPALIVIMLTNYASLENRRKCFDWGADFFFDKSNDIAKLVSVMKGLDRHH